MSITSEKIDYIIRVGLHPVLKQEGFLKSAHTFRRGFNNYTQITNVQGSWTNHDDQGSFTINLAVYFPEAAKLHGVFQVTNRPLEWDCIVSERIGFLMPVHRDFWWEVDSNSNLDEIAKDVVSAWNEYGKPWLEKHSTLEGALHFSLLRKMAHWASIFSLLLGDQEKARNYLCEAIATSKIPEFTSRLKDWGRSHGLTE